MAHPRGGEALASELAMLREAGVDVLVSALTPDDCVLLDLVGEAAAARAAGLEFIAHPIPDYGLPELVPARQLAAPRLRSCSPS